MFKNLKFILLPALGAFIIFSHTFANEDKDNLDYCGFIENMYKICLQNLHNDKDIKKLSPEKRISTCDVASITVSLDVFIELAKRQKNADIEKLKNIGITAGLVCKDACLGTDRYYSVLKKGICK